MAPDQDIIRHLLSNSFILMESVWPTSSSFSLYYGNLHVFDFNADLKHGQVFKYKTVLESEQQSYQEKVNFAHNDIFKMILRLVVFELYVETFLNADLHLDWVVHLRIGGQGVHGYVQLLGHVRQPSHDGHSQKVSKTSQLRNRNPNIAHPP